MNRLFSLNVRCFSVLFCIGFNVIVFPVFGQIINENIKLWDVNGDNNDQFGNSVAIDQGIVAIGAIGNDELFVGAGSAFLFDASTGGQIAQFFPNPSVGNIKFGYCIAIEDSIVAVGAPFDDINGSSSGSVYLFNANTGAQIAIVTPNDGQYNDHFGGAIALDNGILAVGSSSDDDNGSNTGSVYTFNASTGTQIAKFLPNDGQDNANFGHAVDIANDILAVGAYRDDDNGSLSGSAYSFDVLTGVQLNKLLPNDGEAYDLFGDNVSIYDGIVAIGAKSDGQQGGSSGSVYIFNAITGNQIIKLLTNDGTSADNFGFCVTLENGIVAAGAYGDGDNGTDSGSAYLFDALEGLQIAKLLPSDGEAFASFGASIAMDNGLLVVGASLDDTIGAVYVFDVAAYMNVTFVPVTGAGLKLWPNHPNPFNPQTTIAFDMPSEEGVSLRVYDVSGRLVDVLLDGNIVAQGRNEVVWRGRDMAGRVVSAGVYFYRLETGNYSETKRMMLLK